MDLETAGPLHGDGLAPDRQTRSLRAERRAAGRPLAQSVHRELREWEWPLFASPGNMAVHFGLTDTVNPLTASTVWRAFGGLAKGVTVGYASEGFNVTAMGIQGGSQFPSAEGGACRRKSLSGLRRRIDSGRGCIVTALSQVRSFEIRAISGRAVSG